MLTRFAQFVRGADYGLADGPERARTSSAIAFQCGTRATGTA